MSNTKIEWTDKRWNPVTGCTPISEGCQQCYAKRMARRLAGRYGYPADDPFRVTFHPDRLELPLHWKKPQKIFVNSMGDLFHLCNGNDNIDKVYALMIKAHWHIFQVLTKRPFEAYNYYQRFKNGRIRGRIWELCQGYAYPDWSITGKAPPADIPPKNLWLGVTVENAKHKDRIDILRRIPAAIRFISFEPLLGDVGELDLTGIHWVIVGGETGPGARQLKSEWAFNILKQSQQWGVPFFFKKWGSYYKGYDIKQDEICKRIWREFPQTR